MNPLPSTAQGAEGLEVQVKPGSNIEEACAADKFVLRTEASAKQELRLLSFRNSGFDGR